MGTKSYKLLFVFQLLVLLSVSLSANYERNEYRNWPASQVQGLKIENMFGDINIVNSRSDSVTISVIVTIKNLPEARAKQLAKHVNLRFWISDGIVNARTEFGDEFKTNQEFTIEYLINIPNNKFLDIKNMYGNVNFDNLYSGARLNILYGNITANKLIANDNETIELHQQYGVSTFNSINKLDATIEYSKLNAENIEYVGLNSKYSIIKIKNIKQSTVNSQFDHFNIETVDDLNVQTSLSNWEIGSLNKKLNINARYGEFNVSKVALDFESLEIENQYGNIRIQIPNNANYLLESDCYHCKLFHRQGETISKSENNNISRSLIQVGIPENASSIIAKSRYGTINLEN